MDGHEARGHVIVATETLEDGTVVDWVPRHPDIPPEYFAPPESDDAPKPEGVLPGAIPRLAGPPGAVPYVRPTFVPYVEGTSSAASVDEYYESLEPGHPAAIPGDRLYGNMSQNVVNYGVKGYVNNRWSSVQIPSGTDFVIAELSAWCADMNGVATDQVGIVVGRMPGIYSAGHRLGVESFESGDGDWVVGAGYTGWHQVSATYTPGMAIGTDSVVDGTQYETELVVMRQGAGNDHWLVRIGTETIGYFDISERGLSGMSTSACIANWYGEALDVDHLTSPWMSADMGSGAFPVTGGKAANWKKAAYIRLPKYYTAASGAGSTAASVGGAPTDVQCYGAMVTTDGGSDWNPTLFYGGPGGQGTLCRQDPTCATGLVNGTACCDPRCGTCGGMGCSSYLGAPFPSNYDDGACCTGAINTSGINCSTNRPPCKL